MFWFENRYKTSLSRLEVESIIDKIIDIEERDTFGNHWSYQQSGADDLIKGMKEKNQLVIWRTNRTWNGIFYPVFAITLNYDDVSIKGRYNRAAEVIVLLIGLLLIIGLTDFVIGIGLEFPQIFNRLIAAIFLFFLFLSLPIYWFYNLKNQTLKELEKILELSN